MPFNTMPFNRLAGGDRFDFIRQACARCGMAREKFETSGRPWCTSQRSPGNSERLPINQNDEPPTAA
jgi:hypothetical protein